MKKFVFKLLLTFGFVFIYSGIHAQIPKAPERKEGTGPYTQLIIRGVTLINGTGAPPMGPVDISAPRASTAARRRPDHNRRALATGGQRRSGRDLSCDRRVGVGAAQSGCRRSEPSCWRTSGGTE